MSFQVFNVEATGQYRKLFKLYDVTGIGSATGLEVDKERMDVREVNKIYSYVPKYSLCDR